MMGYSFFSIFTVLLYNLSLYQVLGQTYSKCSTYVQGNLELKLSSTGNTCEIDGSLEEHKYSNFNSGYIHGKVYLLNGVELSFEESLTVTSSGKIIIGGLTNVVINAKSFTLIGHIYGNARKCRDQSITSDSKYCGGYNGKSGPGTNGNTVVSASHGGLGRNNAPPVYGSFTRPITVGSGASDGSRNTANPVLGGGAALHLVIEDELSITGSIDMEGSNPGNSYYNGHNYGHRGGGGSSGGSIWIEVGALSGTGKITANGYLQ
jgi:hypothetical protein